MSSKDFFSAVIKILALFLIVSGILPLIPNLFFLVESDISSFFLVTGVILVYFVLIYIMLFNTNAIVQILKLTKGFESDKFNFSNAQAAFVVKIACVIIGLYVISYSLPNVIYELFIHFQKNVSSEQYVGNPYLEASNYQLQISLISVFVGMIIIGVRNQVSNYFTSKTKD